MSDMSGAILKVVSALTSTKTAIKFICIAIFLLISGQALEEFVIQSGSPVEYQKTIILFLGLGLGSIVGDMIVRFGLIIYTETLGRYKNIKKRQQKEKYINRENENLLERFSITYEKMDKHSQRELWELAQGKVSIWDDPESNSNIHIFVSNGYAKHFSTVNEHSSVYELHPVLTEYLKATVPQRLDQAFKKFHADQSEQMLSLLDLLGQKCELETYGFDVNQYVKLCKTHYELLEYSNYWENDDDGFNSKIGGYDIYIDPYHEEKLQELYGVSFKKIRIAFSKNCNN